MATVLGLNSYLNECPERVDDVVGGIVGHDVMVLSIDVGMHDENGENNVDIINRPSYTGFRYVQLE